MTSNSFAPFPLPSSLPLNPKARVKSIPSSDLSRYSQYIQPVTILSPLSTPTTPKISHVSSPENDNNRSSHKMRSSVNLLKPLPRLNHQSLTPCPKTPNLSLQPPYRNSSYIKSNFSKAEQDDVSDKPYSMNLKSMYNLDCTSKLALFNNYSTNSLHQENLPPLPPLDWDSPTDPQNPKNWSNFKKWFVTILTSYLCLVVSFGCSLYVTAIIKLMFHFGVSQEKILLGMTLYLIGLSLAPVIGAPLSERFGRKLIYLSMVPLSMLFMVGSAKAHNMKTVLACRFFTGLFGAPVLAIAAGTIADLWDLDMLVTAMTIFSIAPLAGPILGPIIGGYALQNFNTSWNMVFYIQLIFAGVAIPFLIIMPETFKPVILKNREKKREKEKKRILENKNENNTIDTFDGQTTCVSQTCKISRIFHQTQKSLKYTVFFPIKLLFVEPIILISSIYTSFVFSILFAFLESYTYIFVGKYKFSLGQCGLAFLGIAVGLIIAGIFFILADRFYLQKLFKKQKQEKLATMSSQEKINQYSASSVPGIPEFDIPISPEQVLVICKIGSILLPISLFWQGWTAQYKLHWLVPLAAGIPFGISLIFIFFSLIVYIEFIYNNDAEMLASVFAANNIFRYLVASGFPLFTIRMYKALGIAWSSTIFGGIAFILVPVPWLFEYFGPWLRSKSKYAKQKRSKRTIPTRNFK
ncbi:uncharacterized protein SAPINGB_P001916 [Magnusiomyces paraingens]|uniref:Major facilitator superfamily (MFS) profile domain-containing protein n=1 Tax=Magnusiomyces paraingens TaxID=2606893 RepID=A0A5E8BGV3_9ASCO|nr:uncharacterized protein SAPINGB_P001916 [Saprochaete ingens]VVT48717.1 unnamed protein product [Saprochaete ingens]